jgi:hypothetical protein
VKKSLSRPKSATTTITPTSTSRTSSSREQIVVVIDDNKIKRKIENALEGLSFHCFNFLHNKVLPANKENALIICDYISSIKSEINAIHTILIAPTVKVIPVTVLSNLSCFNCCNLSKA